MSVTDAEELALADDVALHPLAMNTLSPATSPKVRRTTSQRRSRAASYLPPHVPEAHEAAHNAVLAFLKGRTSYDALPVSFRLITLDTKLEVKKALQCLLAHGVVSAVMWNSERSRFAGMFTVNDIIHLIQWYYNTAETFDNATEDLESLKLESLRQIERDLGVAPPPLLSEHPSATLYDTAKRLVETHARRLPLLDIDTDTGHEAIVSVLTTYRLLHFISVNCHHHIAQMYMGLRKLKIGTYVQASPSIADSITEERPPYWPIATVTMDTPVFDVVHMFSERGISAVPILDAEGVVMNLYESVDIITLVRHGLYHALDLTVGQALQNRSSDFQGVIICQASDSLGTLLQLIKRRRVHRLVVVEGEEEERKGGRKGRLLGIITLSDILRYLMGPALDDAPIPSAGETPRMSAPASPAPPPLSSSLEPPSEGVDPIDDWERLERVDEKTPPVVPNANAPANTEAHPT